MPTPDLAIREITATIIDVPTVREHKLSQTSVRAQNYVLVRGRLENGASGIGTLSLAFSATATANGRFVVHATQ